VVLDDGGRWWVGCAVTTGDSRAGGRRRCFVYSEVRGARTGEVCVLWADANGARAAVDRLDVERGDVMCC
jgi:hypothetical protein